MFKLFKKIFIGNRKKDIETNKIQEESIVQKIQNKAEMLAEFASNKFQETINEFGNIKEKMSNLLETNYNLGLKHLERGNISDAVFRFRFIKKFWPHCFDAHYQLAYSLFLNKRPFEAKKILIELLRKNPSYDIKAQELINKIDKGEF